MDLKKIVKRISAILLTAAITFSVLPSVLGNNVVNADDDFEVKLVVGVHDKDGKDLTFDDTVGTVTVDREKVSRGQTLTATVNLNTGYVMEYICFGNGGMGYQSGKNLSFTVPDDFVPLSGSNDLQIDVVIYEEYAYPLWVGGVQVTTENMYDIPGVTGGQATYSPVGNTLTLDNVTGFTGYYDLGSYQQLAVYQDPTADKTLTVYLQGNNNISGLNSHNVLILVDDSDVAITGPGKLTVNSSPDFVVFAEEGSIYVSAELNTTSDRCCLYSTKDIYIQDGANITAKSTDEGDTIFSHGTVYIWGGTLKANCKPTGSYCYPISADGGIDIKDTHDITGVSFDDPEKITNDNCTISGNTSGSFYIYSIDKGERVRGVIIEQVTFSIDCTVYTIDVNGTVSVSNTGGTVTLSQTSGAKGENVTVTAIPAEGYELNSVLWPGSSGYDDITDTLEHKIEDKDVNVLVYFKELDPPVTYSVGVNVTTQDKDGNPITAVGGTATVDKTSGITGDKVTVTATPNEGYQLKSVSWGNAGTSNDITTSKEFVIEDFDVTVDVVFEEIDSSSSSGSSSGSTTAATSYSVYLNVATFDKDGKAITAVGGTASVSSTTGVTGDKITVTATPNEGYELDSIIYGDGGLINDITATKEFIVEDFDPVVDVVFKEVDSSSSAGSVTTDPATGTSGSTSGATMDPSAPTYKVIQGADSVVDGTKDLVIEVQRSEDDEHCIDYFDWVAIDGTKLTDFGLTSGSTIVTIKAEYLKTLSEGKHTVVVNFVDNSVSTTFTLQSVQKGGASIPQTGEGITKTVIGAMMLTAAAGCIVILQKDKKKKSVR